MALLNFTSYSAMAKDKWKSFLPTISGIQCILTFVLALFQGQIKSIGIYDFIVLAVGITASLLWWKLKSPTITNLMLQLGITIGFVPTVQSVWVRPQSEFTLCWFVWTVSFTVQTIVVILRWRGQKRDLAYPVNSLWLHLLVALLALR